MDLQQLCGVLQGCLSADSRERSAAEEVLKQYETSKGQVANLLRVAAETNIDPAIRQFAAISFKNIVKRNWECGEEKVSPLSDEDKAIVRENILEAVIRAPHAIQVQLGEVLKSIVYCDYPERWPDLANTIYSNLISQEQSRTHGALYALRILTRKYEFRDEDDRPHLNAILNTTLPVLLQIFNSLLSLDTHDPQIAVYLKLVCKVFWSATYMGIPDVLLQPEQFMGWMTGVHLALMKPLPLSVMPADLEDRVKWPWWKMKKWAAHISYRLFSRYSQPKNCNPGNDRQFAELFQKHCMIKLLDAHLELLHRLGQGEYFTPRVTNLLLQYLSHAVEVKEAYQHIKNAVEPLLLNIVFPLMCFSDEDATLWTEDPQEYIRKGYDIMEDYYSSKTAAANFAHTVCYRKPKAHLGPFMTHLIRVMNNYNAAVVTATAHGQVVGVAEARHMDGALLAVGSLTEVLKHKAPYRDQLETFLMTYVVPCFSSPYGHLRAKACWISGCYCDIQFSDGAGAGQTFGLLFKEVMNRLHDTDLPVKVDAVVSIKNFMEEVKTPALGELKPIIPQLVTSIFNLMNEVDNEDLVFTLECIVEKFQDDIGPYALDLAKNLVLAFWKYSGAGEDDDDDADEDQTAIAAYGCIKALSTLLDSISNLHHLFPPLEEILFPLMQKLISTEGQDVFEDVLELLAYFTYFPPTVSDRLWSLWPQLHSCLLEWAIDYWEHILVPLDNFISRGTERFLTCTNPNYQESVYQMVHHSLSGQFQEVDILSAPKLMEVVLQNCRGRVDGWVQPYVILCWEKLKSCSSRALKDRLVLVIADAFYYNASLALGGLQSQQALGPVLQGWLHMILERRPSGKPKHFKRVQDKKVCVLGLVSLLCLPDASLPPEVLQGLPKVLTGTLTLLSDLKVQLADLEKARSSGEEDDEEVPGGDSDGDEEDDEENGDAEDDAYVKKLQRAARDLLSGVIDDDSDEEDDDDWHEEEEVTPLDNVDPFVFFVDALKQIQQALPGRYEHIVSACDPAGQPSLQDIIAFSDVQRQKLQHK